MIFPKALLFLILLPFTVLATAVFPLRDTNAPIRIEGKTMGTSYHITYFDKHRRNFKTSIDSLLILVNKSINTYDSTSEVSLFNKSKTGIAFRLPYLFSIIKKSLEVAAATSGAFDPTVMPLVNAWGFGPGKSFHPSHHQLDSILALVGYKKIILSKDSVKKNDARVQLDFGGIGQGFGADVITQFLKQKGIENMLVELGGEGMAVGKNLETGRPWQIGILDPNSTLDNQFFKAYASVKDQSFTTSANYFNYYEVDGVKYAHTINPVTGNPSKHAILSASVFSYDCATADAWATAFMVMGHDRAIEVLGKQKSINAFLIFISLKGKLETYVTPALSNFIKIEPTHNQP